MWFEVDKKNIKNEVEVKVKNYRWKKYFYPKENYLIQIF